MSILESFFWNSRTINHPGMVSKTSATGLTYNGRMRIFESCDARPKDMFSKVPAHDSQSIRLTFFASFFWKRTELALQLIEEDTVWKMAHFGLVTQIGAWYKNCCFMKFQYCPRPRGWGGIG